MKLLLIRNDHIGDLVCTTPLIEALRQAYPEATIDLLGNSYNITILRHDSRLSRLWSYDKGTHEKILWKKWRAYLGKVLLLLRLRQERYDVTILASPNFNKRLVTLACWIGSKKIYGPPFKAACKRPAKTYQQVSIDSSANHALQVFTYARVLKLTTAAPESVKLLLSSQEKEEALATREAILKDQQRPIIGVQLSSRRPKQQWSFEHWKQLIAELLPYGHVRLFWSPGSKDRLDHPGDDLLAQELQDSFPKNALIAQPTYDLRSLMTQFAACDLIVGADGGAMHVASGVGAATLTLFGDVDPAIWAPYSPRGTFLKSPSDNLEDLAPEVVAEKVRSLLSVS